MALCRQGIARIHTAKFKLRRSPLMRSFPTDPDAGDDGEAAKPAAPAPPASTAARSARNGRTASPRPRAASDGALDASEEPVQVRDVRLPFEAPRRARRREKRALPDFMSKFKLNIPMLRLFVAARSRHKAVCGPQGFMRSQENGWSCFSGDINPTLRC